MIILKTLAEKDPDTPDESKEDLEDRQQRISRFQATDLGKSVGTLPAAVRV